MWLFDLTYVNTSPWRKGRINQLRTLLQPLDPSHILSIKLEPHRTQILPLQIRRNSLRYRGDPISDEAIEDWNDAATILDEVTGQVAVHTGTEIFYQGQADWKEPRPSRERIENGLDYPVSSSNTSRVETATDDPSDLEAIVARYEPKIAPVAESGALTKAWERFIEGYEDEDFSPF